MPVKEYAEHRLSFIFIIKDAKGRQRHGKAECQRLAMPNKTAQSTDGASAFRAAEGMHGRRDRVISRYPQ